MNAITKTSLLTLLFLTSAPALAMKTKDPLKNKLYSLKDGVQFQKNVQEYKQYSHGSMLGAISGIGLTTGLCCFGGPLLGVFTLLGSVSSGLLGLHWHHKELKSWAHQWACEEHQRLNQKLLETNSQATLNDKILLIQQELNSTQRSYETLATTQQYTQQEILDGKKHIGLLVLNQTMRHVKDPIFTQETLRVINSLTHPRCV